MLAPLSWRNRRCVSVRAAQGLGAGMVVSEMVVSDELVKGYAEAQLRAEGSGVEPHVVQLAGCDPRSMAEGVADRRSRRREGSSISTWAAQRNG